METNGQTTIPKRFKQNQATTRMLDVKNNFRNKYSYTKCKGCGLDEETQSMFLKYVRSSIQTTPYQSAKTRYSKINKQNSKKQLWIN